MKTLLITGFDPFGGEHINPAWEAVKRLPDTVGDYHLEKLQIPTVFEDAAQIVLAAAHELHPHVILCIGQAGGRKAVTPEMAAINLRYASIPDNLGKMPQDRPCVPGGPAAYFATVPVRKMAEAIANANLPGAVSYSAGAYVCNDTLYSLLHHYDGTNTRVGFIHVPFLPEQAKENVPSLPLHDIVRALEIAIEQLD